VFQGGEVGVLYRRYRQRIVDATPDGARRTVRTQRLYALFRWVADQT